MLKNNEYVSTYRSIFNDFDKEFLEPSYSQSIRFDRGSGYFSLQSLVLSMDGLIEFINNGGNIRLICNPELSDVDIEMISKGVLIDNDKATMKLRESLEKDNLTTDDSLKMDVVCNLIACGRMMIKVAYMPDGIYHEKLGIFTDETGDMVYFNGSANETYSAHKKNFESFTVIKSWDSLENKQTILKEKQYFEMLWNDQIEDDSIVVYEFPDALKEEIFSEYKVSDSISKSLARYYEKKEKEEKKKRTLYPFQEDAINEFVMNGYHHFFEMATGTGKTFTSVRTIKRVMEQEKKIFMIICVPQLDLQTQWLKALNDEGFDDVLLFGGEADTKTTADNITSSLIHWYSDNKSIFGISIYDTFFSKIYDKCNNIDNLFVVFDEAHNLNMNQISRLPKNAKMKLGLSATIERFNSLEEKAIVKYFTEDMNPPFYFGIEEAIDGGFLSHYNYYPIYVRLDDDSYCKYEAKTKKIGQLLAQKNNDDSLEIDEQLNKLRNDRSLIIKQASVKIDKLEEMIGNYDFRNSVVYCGQGKDDDESIVNIVTDKLYKKGNYTVSQFTSKTKDRKQVLYEFENGYYDTLVAIKCFDEGVDIPKLDKIYILASDSSMRQTVQRRGRVLRKCKETGKTIASIYDMIVLPPIGATNVPKALILSEFGRAYEYSRLADNRNEIESTMDNYISEYGVTREELDNERKEESN